MARALAIILSLVALHARAETVQRPLPDIVGARAAAMGDAYVGAPAGAPGYFHNPAALGLLRGVRLFVQTNVTGRVSIEMDPKGIAYGWRRVGMAWGNRIAEDRRGIADYTHLSGGVALSSRVAVGVAAKFWRSHPWPRFQTVGGSATYDVGALVAGPAGWTFGARAGQLAKGEGPRAAAAGVWREGDANGVTMTADAFRATIGASGVYILITCIAFFSMTTIFTYSYYGTKCLGYLAGADKQHYYNYIIVLMTVVSSVLSLDAMIALVDGAFALMAIPTMVSTLVLSPRVMAAARVYFADLRRQSEDALF